MQAPKKLACVWWSSWRWAAGLYRLTRCQPVSTGPLPLLSVERKLCCFDYERVYPLPVLLPTLHRMCARYMSSCCVAVKLGLARARLM